MQPHQEKTCSFHKRAYGSKIASGFKSIILHSFLLQSNIQYANELFSQLIPLITHLFLFCPNCYLLTRPPSSFPEGAAASKTLSLQPDGNCSIFEIKFAVQIITINQMKYALQKKKIRKENFAVSGNFSIQLVQCWQVNRKALIITTILKGFSLKLNHQPFPNIQIIQTF